MELYLFTVKSASLKEKPDMPEIFAKMFGLK